MYVKVTFKVAIRTSQRLAVAIMISLFCQMTCIHGQSTCELCVTGRVESDHVPLAFRVIFPKENVCSDEVSHHEQIIEKFVWDNLSAQTFTSLMCTDETCAIPDEATSLIDFDIDKALDIFNNCIKEKAECIKKQMLPPTF